MKRIDVTNTLRSTCNKKQATNSNTMKIDDNDVCEIIEDVHKWDKLDKEFDISLISECEYDEDTSENEEESSGTINSEENDELWQYLLVVKFYNINMIQK